MAVGDDIGNWFLINASPDLPAQIGSCSDLHPHPNTLRCSLISGVLLTNADLDHVLGLFSLREGGRLNVHATRAVRNTLDECLGLTSVMSAFCGVDWHEPPEGDFVTIIGNNGKQSNLTYRAIRLHGGPPLFSRSARPDDVHSIAYHIVDRKTGGRLLVAPDVARCNKALTDAMEDSDAIFFDGTFWSDDELLQIKTNGKKAAEMGHLPIKDFMLQLGSFTAKHKIYIHLNNTNPVLSRDSQERAAVESAGIRVGQDGMEFNL
jgi:pyrroloquinoline quinone biosynthesis protein B